MPTVLVIDSLPGKRAMRRRTFSSPMEPLLSDSFQTEAHAVVRHRDLPVVRRSSSFKETVPPPTLGLMPWRMAFSTMG